MVLRVENYGQLRVVLPVGHRNTNLRVQPGSIRYTAMLPLTAGVPGGGTMLGWLELYGSTLKSNTTVSLKPGEWITVRGDIRVHGRFGPLAIASSNLQLYEWFAAKSNASVEKCVKQVSGASIPVRFGPLKNSP